MNFNNFWKWLCRQKRRIETLGRRRKFKIQAANDAGTIISSKSRIHHFSKRIANEVWNRYRNLGEDQHRAGRYVDGPRVDYNWNPCPHRFCSPWIAAAIRDFESENKL
jgi:hypothetical protein